MTCGVAPRALAAQRNAPPAARWTAHVGAGFATIHGADLGLAAVAGIGRRLGTTGETLVTGDIGWGGSDDGFAFLQGGLQWRPPPIGTVEPFLNGGLGLLTEPEFTGILLRAGVGIDVPMGPGTAIRLQGHVAGHSDEAGPNGITLGVAFTPGGAS